MNELCIKLIEKIDYDDFERMWVRLTCGSESREICFEPCINGEWAYLEGEIEPIMPPHIKKIWDSKYGDEILTAIWNGDDSTFVIDDYS